MSKKDRQWVDKHYGFSITTEEIHKRESHQAEVFEWDSGLTVAKTGWHHKRIDAEEEAYQLALRNKK